MRITILCVGKIKEKFYRDAVAEYVKRLSRYCQLEIIEVADERTVDGASELEVEQVLEREASRVLPRIEKCRRSGAYIFALAIDGRQMDSVEFAGKMGQLALGGTSHIAFMIGGSLGMADSLESQADERLGFSKMTFPHQLMRVILLEQVYRGFRIINNEPYHK